MVFSRNTVGNSDKADSPPEADKATASDLWTALQAFIATRDARGANARSIADRAAANGVQK